MSRIAIAQITSSTNKQENLVLANQLITEATGKSVRMIAFPEFLMAYSPDGQSAEDLCSLAESVEGPFTTVLRETAKNCGIHVVANIYERSSLPNRVYDASLWIDSTGA